MKNIRLSSLIVVAAIASGCAKERSAINRVQPNYLDKSTLSGEWYYGRTVVDVPEGETFTFVGNGDGVKRVVFDIQENTLYARRTTELVKNGDGKASEGERYVGEAIAAFKIDKHFDIARQYNAVTGEELNVLEENDSDRPWYERQYLRVDWSENLVHNYDLDFEAQSVESVPYFVQEIDPTTGERHPDAPVFEDGYFDITSKLFAKAGTIDFPGYGTIPLCWLGDFGECGASEYTIRHSFLRVGDRGYEPRPYKGKETEVFGFFDTTRMVYDPQTGVRRQSTERYLNRHNIWERSIGIGGAVIPVEYRTPRPIVYFVNRDWPKNDDAITTAARHAADQWNQIFREVVIATGHDLGDKRMFVLCEHNPVIAGDPAECGPVGNSPRIGDIRYSFLAYVPKFMTYGLLGLGPSNTDPETGEILSGMAYVYHWNNVSSYQTMEMVELLNGSRSPTSYIDGVDLTEWRNQVTSNQSVAHTYGLDQAQNFISRLSSGNHVSYWDGQRRAPDAADEAFQREQGTRKWLAPFFADLKARGISQRDGVADAKLARLVGTEVEAQLLSSDLYTGMGFNPATPLAEGMKDQVSVLRGGFGKFAAARSRALEEWADKRNLYTAEMADDGLMGLAREYASSGMTSEQIYNDVRRIIYTAVLTHEAGYSLGLMHNFGGSDDAINYFDDYWKIRAEDGTVAPRLVDPITENEVNKKIYNYAYSSIMDYAGRYTIDGGGVGKYDRAAMLFGYGNKVEVFKNRHGISGATFRDWFDNDGDILGLYNDGPKSVHYTSFYNTMGQDLYDAGNRELVDVSTLSDDLSTSDGRARVPYIYCSHSRSDLGDGCLTRDAGADSAERMQNILDELDTWYIQRAFPRGVVGNDQWSYVGKYYGRIYHRLKQWNDIFGLYKDLLPRYYNSTQLAAFYSDPVEGWGTKTWAVQNAFNYLMGTILMPNITTYAAETAPDGSTLLNEYPWNSGGDVTLDVKNGRYFSTSWWDGSRECGYTWWECLHHIGFYLDKIMAIEAMSDSNTNYVGRSTPEDIREWRVSYFNTFAEPIAKVSTALMAQDWSRVAPYLESGEVKFPNYAGALTEVHAQPINPSATFTIQLYWQVLGKARFVSNFDPSFAEESRVFEMGSGLEPTLPADELVTFTDPWSRLTYGAVSYPDHEGSGAAAIRHANMLLARSTYCDVDASTATLDDDCVAASGTYTPEALASQLRSYAELVKSMVHIDTIMEWGNPYDP